jgi:hypothetical protein
VIITEAGDNVINRLANRGASFAYKFLDPQRPNTERIALVFNQNDADEDWTGDYYRIGGLLSRLYRIENMATYKSLYPGEWQTKNGGPDRDILGIF